MKHTNALFAGLVATAMILVTSCGKDDEAKPAEIAEVSDACQATEVIYNSGSAKELFEYDSGKKLIKSSYYEGDELESITKYEYTNGRVSKVIQYNEDNSVSSTQVITYNDKGQWTKITEKEDDDEEVTIQATYDGNGNRIKITSSSLNTQSETTFEYANGNLVKEKEVAVSYGSKNESVTTYEYYLDKENKWKNIQDMYALGYSGTASKNMEKKIEEKYTAYDEDSKPAVGYTYSATYTYEYNDKGFPTRVNTTQVNEGDTDVRSVVYQYNCK